MRVACNARKQGCINLARSSKKNAATPRAARSRVESSDSGEAGREAQDGAAMACLARLRPSNKARARAAEARARRCTIKRGVRRGERGWFLQSKVFKGGYIHKERQLYCNSTGLGYQFVYCNSPRPHLGRVASVSLEIEISLVLN